MAETVTIGKTYFEALCRRAESGKPASCLAPEYDNTIHLTKFRHENLLQIEKQYHLLCNALLSQGVTKEALKAIVEPETGLDHDKESFVNVEAARTDSSPVPLSSRNASSESWRKLDHTDCVALQKDVQHRMILISNLARQTTLSDLESILYGGRIFHLHLRDDLKATVAFVEGASEYLEYARKGEIMLHGRKLDFAWATRQFYIPLSIAHKIEAGATRNLVLRSVNQSSQQSTIKGHLRVAFSDEDVRHDLAHIDGLSIISVNVHEGVCYISTTSLRHALFARTCMMSQVRYKGLKIDWAADDCARPLPPIRQDRQDGHSSCVVGTGVAPAQVAPKSSSIEISNMFALLGLEEVEGETSDSETSEP